LCKNFKRHKIKNHSDMFRDRMRSIIREYKAVLDWNSKWFTDVCCVLVRCLAA